VELADLSRGDREAVVLADYVDYFGEQAARPTRFIDANWPVEPYTGGAFTAFFGPGGWTGFGSALREPVGRIHWAGTETAVRWNGYFDGAVRAGEDAAADVLARLKSLVG
jgi:monoamine oxidase